MRVPAVAVRVLALIVKVLSVIVNVLRVIAGVLVFVHAEFRGRHSGAEYLPGVHVRVAEGERSERLLQVGQRQAGVEQRADRHVAGDPGKAVEIQHPAHNTLASLKL